MRRFKVGDLARINYPGDSAHGQIVEILEESPQGVVFDLPDGQSHDPTFYEWIVGVIGTEVSVPMTHGTRRTRYMAAPERVLEPLPGDDEESDIEEPQYLEGCR